MLLPDKHVSIAESILGLGSFILEQLDRPKSMDSLHNLVTRANEKKELPAFHNFESVTLAVLFLYTIGAVEMTRGGDLKRCAS